MINSDYYAAATAGEWDSWGDDDFSHRAVRRDLMTGPQHSVEVRDVSFRYAGTTVLDNVSFDARPGVTALVGVNGAGKTTLFKLLAGMLQPESGKLRTSASVGYLPQNPTATALLSAAAYVEYFGLLAGVSRRRVPMAAAGALAAVDMADRARARTSSLSGGMFRRVALAAALVAEPAVLLLDEPTAGLDPVQRSRFRDLVRELGRDRVVLVASHLLEDVASVADRILVLHNTRLLFDGTVAGLAQAGTEAGAPSLERAVLALLDGRE